jgi:hypothetical protein
MADIVLINPKFEISFFGLDYAAAILGKRAANASRRGGWCLILPFAADLAAAAAALSEAGLPIDNRTYCNI